MARGHLTPLQVKFVATYYLTEPRNAVEAYMAAFGCSRDSAMSNAATMMNSPNVRAEMAHWENFRQNGTRLTIEQFNAEVNRLTFADSRELTGWRIGACRYCHGDRFLFQRTPSEFARDLEKYLKDNDAMFRGDPVRHDPAGLLFPIQGGMGYTRKKDPHPDCPECFGDGEGYSVISDTRYLSEGAARLYDGVKQTKDGIEIKVRNRDALLKMYGQSTGALNKQPADDDTANTVRITGGLPDDDSLPEPPEPDTVRPNDAPALDGAGNTGAMPVASPGAPLVAAGDSVALAPADAGRPLRGADAPDLGA